MASYYYLMSSLPMLKSDGEMPFRYEQFLGYCKETVSEAKYRLLENLTLESTEGPLVSEWARFYKLYKDELTYQRKKNLELPATPPFDKDSEASKTISAALWENNPLTAEKNLLALQFERLDSLIGTHTFDDHALFGYALKLKLLERKTVFDKQKGKAEFTRLVDRLEQQIASIN